QHEQEDDHQDKGVHPQLPQDDGPRKQEDDLDVEDDKQEGEDVVADVEGSLAFAHRNFAALVGSELFRIRVVRPQQPPKGQVQGDETSPYQKKDEDVGVCADHDSPSPRRLAPRLTRLAPHFTKYERTTRLEMRQKPPEPPRPLPQAIICLAKAHVKATAWARPPAAVRRWPADCPRVRRRPGCADGWGPPPRPGGPGGRKFSDVSGGSR